MPASAWTPPAALAVLEVACRTVGVDYAGSELVRFGTNAIYRLPDRKHLARVSRPGRDRDAVQRELDIARWLAEERFPALPPADDISDEPLQVGACVVSFWTWLDHDPGRPPDAYEFGKLLRRFHEVSARYVADLPPIDPLGLVARELAWLREHGPYRADDLDLLEGWRERLTAELASVRSQLGEGPLHGDAHPGNVLRTPSGLVLVDFEHAAWGIREWDLVPFALRHRRLGGSPVEYASFATGYGHDLAGQEHWETLARVRELGMTTWRMLIDASSSVRAESHRRIAYWRGEPTGRWRAF